jgi:ribosome-binding ATPase YchF (GTP1/OBG family)
MYRYDGWYMVANCTEMEGRKRLFHLVRLVEPTMVTDNDKAVMIQNTLGTEELEIIIDIQHILYNALKREERLAKLQKRKKKAAFRQRSHNTRQQKKRLGDRQNEKSHATALPPACDTLKQRKRLGDRQNEKSNKKARSSLAKRVNP